jgi:hypothetical protein
MLSRTARLIIPLAIVAIAAGAYLLDRQRPVDEAAILELETTMQSTALELQERLDADINARQLAEEKSRSETEDGLKLAGLCNAWIEFDANHPSESTAVNRDRACGNYRRYITTGELPELEAEPP